MNYVAAALATTMMTTGVAYAGGIERHPQSMDVLFAPGNYAEFTVGRIRPDVSGTDVAGYGSRDLANDFSQYMLSYKHQINDSFSVAIIIGDPFGASTYYPTVAEGGSFLLGGTRAEVSVTEVTTTLRYHANNGASVYGGLRFGTVDGEVTLDGAAYGSTFGAAYHVPLERDTAIGYVVGVAYEMPELAARIALTYNSEMSYDFDTKQTIGGFTVPNQSGTIDDVTMPQSVQIEGQTGVAPGTLVFGSIRWVDWSELKLRPSVLGGQSLTDLEDSTTYKIGIGRKFTENWSGAATFTYEAKGADLVSPLSPVNGRKGVTLAAIYTQGSMKVTAGVNYTKLGDATAAVGRGTSSPKTLARMEDNDVIAVGLKFGFSF